MSWSHWIRTHKRSLLFLVGVLIVGGLATGLRMPVALFPTVEFPRVVVNIESGDQPAERMAFEVTYPIENAVRAVNGVRSVRSTTSRGSADVSVNFNWGEDMVSAKLQVEAALAQALPDLPQGTRFTVRRMDPNVFPVIGYTLTSPIRDQVYLRDLAYYEIRPQLQTVAGVASVEVLGGDQEEYRVTVDPAQLAAHRLTVESVRAALEASNVVSAVGRLEDEYKLYLLVAGAQMRDIADVGDAVLKGGTGGVVRLKDIATVSKSTVPQWIRVSADGEPAVIVQVYQQPSGSTVQIAGDIRASLTNISAKLPPDVRLSNWYDQSELILAATNSVRDAVLIGVLLAAFVLWIFLRNARVTLVAIVMVPAVLAAATLLLRVFGMSFNLMTLGGMAAAVGLVIDDAIVVIEHIVRRRQEGERDVLAAAREFTRPLVGSSASTIIVFAPLAFLSGVTGAFFRALSLTMAAALVLSFLIAWLVIPILADRLLENGMEEKPDRITAWLFRHYESWMHRLLARPGLVVVGLLVLSGVGYVAFHQTGSGFMPATDEGGFILDYLAPPGTSLEETDRLLVQVEDILQQYPWVQTYSRRTGIQLGGGITEANEGDYFIRLKPGSRPGIETVMDDIRSQIEAEVPGLSVEMAQLMEDLIGDLTAVPQPIEVKLFADDSAVLDSLAPLVAEKIGGITGVVDVLDGIMPAGDALDIRIDRVKAAMEGVDPNALSAMLSDQLAGAVATGVQRPNKVVPVRVWIPFRERSRVADVEKLLLQAPDGHLFPLRRVASIERVTGQPQITREDLKQMVPITGRISGRDLGSTIRDVKALLDAPGALPSGVYYTLGGLYEQQQVAFRGLLYVFAAAVALIFALLLYLYESFRVALAIQLTTLVAFGAVYLGLWITGTELNVTSMMGLTMIVGMATEVSIFYQSEVHDLTSIADRRVRYIVAGKNRMRPILMTTLAAILALLPLALGIGQGSGMLQPLAIAIIAGLAVHLPLVVVALPALLVLFGVHPEEDAAPNLTQP